MPTKTGPINSPVLQCGWGRSIWRFQKKIVISACRLVFYGQNRNVRSVNRVYNGPMQQRKVTYFERVTIAEHCTFALAALYNGRRVRSIVFPFTILSGVHFDLGFLKSKPTAWQEIKLSI
jgi:hypothetical protein